VAGPHGIDRGAVPEGFDDAAPAYHFTARMDEAVREGLGRRIAAGVHGAAGPQGFAYTFVKLFAVARRPGS